MLCVLGGTPVMVWVLAPVRPAGSGEGDILGNVGGCVLVCMYVCA